MGAKTAVGTITRVQVEDGGRLVLPEEIRRELGVEPGATVQFRVSEPGTVVMTSVPSVTLNDLLARYPPVAGPVDVEALITEGEAAAADEALRKMGLPPSDE